MLLCAVKTAVCPCRYDMGLVDLYVECNVLEANKKPGKKRKDKGAMQMQHESPQRQGPMVCANPCAQLCVHASVCTGHNPRKQPSHS